MKSVRSRTNISSNQVNSDDECNDCDDTNDQASVESVHSFVEEDVVRGGCSGDDECEEGLSNVDDVVARLRKAQTGVMLLDTMVAGASLRMV